MNQYASNPPGMHGGAGGMMGGYGSMPNMATAP